jgi:CRISPR-associated protein Csm3
MHAKFYNEAVLRLGLRPRTPLLIKARGEGASTLDPTVPDMNFVRTKRAGREPEVYIPGSSLRGVVRSYAERLLRSVGHDLACDPTDTRGTGKLLRECGGNKERMKFKKDPTELDGAQAYNRSCYACRLFGNTALAGRLRVGDLYVEDEPLLETRYGVAIDRVTGAVAQGPFELETLTDATLAGTLTLRNFTLGQLGLLAAALLDLSDGLVPMGFGKSRGLGRVQVTFRCFSVRTTKDPQGYLRGVGYWADQDDRRYRLPSAEEDQTPWDLPAPRVRGFFEAAMEDDAQIRAVLEQIAARWPQEVGA